MSKGALDKYKQQYSNVYLKGALISMCLDLKLLKLSGGKYGLQDLKHDLVIRYGPDKPFDDEELFDVITEMTFPEIRDFFRRYVEGPERLPYKEYLSYAGFDYYEKFEREVPAMLGVNLDGDSTGNLIVTGVNEFGEKLKLKTGDIIFSINGEEVKTYGFDAFKEKFDKSVKAGDEVTVVVLRKNKAGDSKKKTLKAETYMVTITDKYVIIPSKNPANEQLEKSVDKPIGQLDICL
jgi:predicted metalloprotease with PDZ domain